MYLAKRSRPNVLKEVAYLASKVMDPSIIDKSKLARLEEYLAATVDNKLIMQIFASVDASYSIHFDSKGHTGVLISLGKNGCTVMEKSVEQKLVARSSTESELIALDDGLCFILWCRKLMDELGFKQLKPTTI
jgi:hypothetical protein